VGFRIKQEPGYFYGCSAIKEALCLGPIRGHLANLLTSNMVSSIIFGPSSDQGKSRRIIIELKKFT